MEKQSTTHDGDSLMYMHTVKHLAAIAGVIALCFSGIGIARADMADEFTAVYSIEKFSSTLGRATYRLEHKDATVHFSMLTELTGFFALFRKDRLEENSWLSQHNNQWRLNKYSYQQSGSKHSDNMLVTIDWPEDNADQAVFASGQYAGKAIKLPVDHRIRDALSFQLALMQDIDIEGKTLDYDVISKGEISHYQFKRMGEETLELNGREIKTQVIERQHDSRITRLWLAVDYQNIPVKIVRIEDGEIDTQMTIDTLVLSGKRIL
jgi:Protein of unknown function (DUF3108)